MKYKLLSIDTSYTLEFIQKSKLHEVLSHKNLGSYFSNVWTIHPVASLTTSSNWSYQFGKPVIYEIDKNNYFIEGKIGRFNLLKYFKTINFLIGQIELAIYLIKLINKEKINFIKSNDIHYCGILSLILRFFTKVKVIVRVGSNNDKIYEVTKQPIQKKLFLFRSVEKYFERLILRKADFVIGANNNNLEFAINNGAKFNKSTVIRYGSLIDDLHYVHPDKRKKEIDFLKKNKLEENKFILYIGRLEKVKHPEDVIHVLKKILSNSINYKALLIGDGKEIESLKNLTESLDIKDDVIFAGNKSQIFISNIIPSSSIIVSPHTGRALCEVSLAGACVVAYDLDWQSEIIENNVNGYLASYRNVNELGNLSLSLIRDKNKQLIFQENLRFKALNMLDKKKLIKQEIEIFEKLINQ